MSPGQGQKTMGTVLAETPYECDRCGATNIVAAPVVYCQGTHSYSSRLGSGISQSFYARAVAPPRPRQYVRPLFPWGLGILFSGFWGSAGVSAFVRYPSSGGNEVGPVAFLVLLGLSCCLGLLVTIRRIARYNREVYPRLLWNWEHTYICRRCGKSQLIPS